LKTRSRKYKKVKTKLKLFELSSAGLIHEDENLTPKQVGAMIDLSKLEEVTNALMEAIEGAMPSKDSVQLQEASEGNPQ